MSQKIPLKLASFFLFTALTSLAFGQQVSQIKGTKALVELSGTSASPGQEFYTLDSNGKKKSILKIKQVKGDKAIAEITKGTAEVGHTLKAKGAPVVDSSASEDSSAASEEPRQDRAPRPRGFLGSLFKRGTNGGVLGGLAQSTMSLSAKSGASSEDITMTGNSFNVLGFYDLDLSPMFTTRLKAGLETFEASSSTNTPAVCSNSSSCNAGFTYLSGEATAHFNLLRGKTRVWIGGGMTFFFTLAKKTSVSNLDTSNQTNQMFLLGSGSDIGLTNGAFVPVSFEYGFFPTSSGVKASMMILRAGYGWRF